MTTTTGGRVIRPFFVESGEVIEMESVAEIRGFDNLF
jgi:hypothetical protein